ncbi:hypothetical protein M378DRAFT_159449 [Amanita muscaria Koide BX008]|uniref:Uncharacterized protein n=1 Tax=Amanita muscaria (strain Koide BX008) TaxID=946122 RepID=A0A0C2XFI8_AMAMK|nr:hypothetical protein M378DRAFT_159449 [Amanita muscaria Koide BX008]
MNKVRGGMQLADARDPLLTLISFPSEPGANCSKRSSTHLILSSTGASSHKA